MPARKGQKYVIAAQTSELLSPAELLLTLRDAKGAVVGKSEPDKPARLELTASDDGQYTLTAEHLNFAFGPNEVYRITLGTPTPGFDVTLASDQLMIAQGFGGLIPIQSLARRDFGGAIELSVVGPKGLHGSLIVPPGAESGPPPAAGQPAGAALRDAADPGGRGSRPRRLRSASPGSVGAAAARGQPHRDRQLCHHRFDRQSEHGRIALSTEILAAKGGRGGPTQAALLAFGPIRPARIGPRIEHDIDCFRYERKRVRSAHRDFHRGPSEPM